MWQRWWQAGLVVMPHDDVDRRIAPAIQLLLLFYGLGLPLNWLWQTGGRPVPTGWTLVLALDLLTSAIALTGILMVRTGRLRRAVRLFVIALLGSSAATWYKLGAHALLIDQTPLLLMLVMAGLVLGRRAMWLTWMGIVGVFALGMHTDYHAAHDGQWTANAMRNGPSLLLAWLIIAFILDRTASALRDSLLREQQHGVALREEMDQRELLQQHLLHAQKLEIAGRLTSGIAHDFNNVLAVIRGFCDERDRLIDGRAQREAALVEALEGIDVAARRGDHICRALLGLSRQDSAHAERFCVGVALDKLQPMLRQLFVNRSQLQLAEVDAEAHLCMDRNQFDLMMLNLVANARDALGAQARGRVRIEVALDAGSVHVVVADDGHGMDVLTRQRMFDPFFSTKPRDRGTGLGLAVVNDVVRDNGGRIEVHSILRVGTRIALVLPAA